MRDIGDNVGICYEPFFSTLLRSVKLLSLVGFVCCERRVVTVLLLLKDLNELLLAKLKGFNV